MRRVHGELLLPANAPAGVARKGVIEVRDVSLQDAPSVVVASKSLSKVALQPAGRLAFELEVPEAQPGRTLNLRVHFAVTPRAKGVALSETVEPGDLLTTESIPVPAAGDYGPLRVRLALIS